MHATIQPNQHFVSHVAVEQHPDDPDLISVRIVETHGYQNGETLLWLDREHWQRIADQLAGVGVVARVDEQVSP